MTTSTSLPPLEWLGPPADGYRLLARVPADGVARSLNEHRRDAPPPPAPRRRPRSELLDSIEQSGLRGHGGAGFPTGTKLRAVAAQGRRPIVVVNGAESEPVSAKDRLLLMTMPHLVIDGAVVAASAVGAKTVIVCVKRTARGSLESLERALAERNGTDGVDLLVVATPPRYVAGEETALVHFLNGGPAKPTITPPRPFERGVDGQPTLVQNVETLAHMAQIAAYGPRWFREAGTADEPGTTLLTVGRRVYEVGFGTTLASLLVASDMVEPLAGVLVGGYFGAWLAPAAIADARVSNPDLLARGAAIGCGAIVPLAAKQCALVESARVVHWLARENAGQCGPCVNGLAAIANTFTAIVAGRADGRMAQQLVRWCSDIEGRGACRHPDGAIRFLRSAVSVFADDLERHMQGRPCAGVHERPVLPVPATGEQWR